MISHVVPAMTTLESLLARVPSKASRDRESGSELREVDEVSKLYWQGVLSSCSDVLVALGVVHGGGD